MPATEIIVNTPSSSSNWQKGTTKSITWSASVGLGYSIDSFHIYLYNGGALDSTIATGLSSSARSYSWAIPSNTGSDTDYRVQVKMNYSSGGPG